MAIKKRSTSHGSDADRWADDQFSFRIAPSFGESDDWYDYGRGNGGHGKDHGYEHGDRSFVITLKNGDVFVYAPGNTGTIDTSQYGAVDIFVFAPGNKGTILAYAQDHDTASKPKTAYGKQDAKAEAKADADAEVFIVAPGNKGFIAAEAFATAEAVAEAKAEYGMATAIAKAEADALVYVFAAGNKGQFAANAFADADAVATAENEKGNVLATTSIDANAEVIFSTQMTRQLEKLFDDELDQYENMHKFDFDKVIDPWT